jgi:hypothetical protein
MTDREINDMLWQAFYLGLRVRPCPVVSLRLGNGLVFGPFYGEAQPRLLLGPLPLAGRLSPPARERIRAGAATAPGRGRGRRRC